MTDGIPIWIQKFNRNREIPVEAENTNSCGNIVEKENIFKFWQKKKNKNLTWTPQIKFNEKECF